MNIFENYVIAVHYAFTLIVDISKSVCSQNGGVKDRQSVKLYVEYAAMLLVLVYVCGMGHLRKETQESVDSDAFGSRTGEVDGEMG